jgi:hypothetical protein
MEEREVVSRNFGIEGLFIYLFISSYSRATVRLWRRLH